MKLKFKAILCFSVLSVAPCAAQTFPLSENSWSNPEFVERFLGSYGFDTSVTPSITSEEKALFEAIAGQVESAPQSAIQELKTSLTPDSSAALIYTLGNLYLQTGNTNAAISEYQKAIEAFPNFLRAYKNLGIVYIQQGSYEMAVKMLLKALELGGQGSDVYGLIGYAYMNLGDSVSALRAYEHALFFDPTSRDWRMGKVQALSNIGRYEDVIALIDQLLEEFPMQHDLLLLQANAFIAKGQSENAAATLEILKARGSATSNALMLLGDIYLNFQQPDLALNAYRSVAEDPGLSWERAFRIAKRLAATAAWEQVDHFLEVVKTERELNLSPDESMELLNLQAQSDLAQNRDAAAAEKLTEVVSKDPLNGQALLLLANYHWSQNKIELAEIYYERATHDDTVVVNALVQHARMLVALREYRSAVILLERAQSIEFRSHVGEFLEKVKAATRTTAK